MGVGERELGLFWGAVGVVVGVGVGLGVGATAVAIPHIEEVVARVVAGAAHEDDEEEVGQIHQRRDGHEGVDNAPLPGLDEDAQEEEAERYFKEEDCEQIEGFARYDPVHDDLQLFDWRVEHTAAVMDNDDGGGAESCEEYLKAFVRLVSRAL